VIGTEHLLQKSQGHIASKKRYPYAKKLEKMGEKFSPIEFY